MWLYPWDVFDYEPARLASELHAMGVSDVFLALSHHSVRVLLPDNPRRRFFDAPQAALYVRPDRGAWADLDFDPSVAALVLEAGDAAQAARTVFAQESLRLVAWTVCLHDSGLARRRPDAAMVNVWGERCTTAVCLANPWTRAYASVLVRDLAPRVDAVQLEAAHWIPPHAVHAKVDAGQPHLFARLTALCTCEWCARAMSDKGVDPERLRAELGRVAAAAVGEPADAIIPEEEVDSYLCDAVHDCDLFLQSRTATVTSLVAELASATDGTRLEFVSYGDRRVSGADLSAIQRMGVDVRVLAYGRPDDVHHTLDRLRGSPDAPEQFSVGLSALPSDAPDQASLRAAHDIAVDSGATSIAYYNYGLVTGTRRRWLGALMQR